MSQTTVAIDVGHRVALHAPRVDRVGRPLRPRIGRTLHPRKLVTKEVAARHVRDAVPVHVAERDVMAIRDRRHLVGHPAERRILVPQGLPEGGHVERIAAGEHVHAAVAVHVAGPHRRPTAELVTARDERRRELRIAVQQQVLVAADDEVDAPIAVHVARAHALRNLTEFAAREVVALEQQRRLGVGLHVRQRRPDERHPK
jgi:hypothetical protein